MVQYQEYTLMLVSQLVWYRKYVLAVVQYLLVTVQQSAQQQVLLLYLQTVLLSILKWKEAQMHPWVSAWAYQCGCLLKMMQLQ